METFPEALAQADADLKAGRLAQAADGYRDLLKAEPLRVDLLGSLGLVLAALGQREEAVLRYVRLLVLRPDHAEARGNLTELLWQFGLDLVDQGLLEEASLGARGAFLLDAKGFVQLGHFFQFHGNARAAIAQYERAVALDPACTEALVRLGTLHAEEGRPEAAVRWFQWALAVAPDLAEANFNLAAIFESQARLMEAQLYRRRVPRPMPLDVQIAPDPQLRVLVACGAGSGTLPLDLLLPRATTTRILWFPEGSTDEQVAELPPFDVAFNAIGNADLAGFSLARLSRFQERQPLLNPPERVLRTRRDRMPELLAGLDGVVVPRVVRLDRGDVHEEGILAKLKVQGLGCPLLVRPIGTQGGKGACRVETPDQWEGAIASEADAFYVMAFHDTCSPDGHYRKYRMIFVDRVAYPYHLAISPNWLVHWYSAGMGEAAWKREEEKRFLEDPLAVLGPEGLQAIEAIGRRLDLEYAGVDFTVLPDGRILVFEANATMLVHLHDSETLYPYKHLAVPALLRAFQTLLQKARSPRRALDLPKGT